MIKNVDRIVEKPIIVLALDDSESVLVGEDSVFYKTDFLSDIGNLSEHLQENYDVNVYRFSDAVEEGIDQVSYSGLSTDYTTLFDNIYTKYSNRNLGAIVLMSDGIYNKGMNPIYSFKKLEVPVYTVALGDTAQKRDVLINEVLHNRLAYLGNEFPIEISVEAKEAAGENLQVQLRRKGELVFSQELIVENEYLLKTIPVTLPAEETGLQKYTVVVSSIENEVTRVNNRKDIFIDILDSRQKVLLLAAAPHPDIAALKKSIESNDNYEVESFLIKDFDKSIQEFNLAIFHQLPNNISSSESIVKEALDNDVPSLFVFGTATDFNKFNKLSTGFELQSYKGSNTEIHASYSEEFSLFKLREETKEIFKKMPPLHKPFGELVHSPGISKLLDQRVGLIETENPLVAFNKIGANKIALIGGEGIWRWKLFNYLENGTHKEFDEFTQKMVQYLASKDDKRRFRVHGESDYSENDRILFDAEYYNESFEPINEDDISMEIEDDEGNEFNFAFSKYKEAYRLEIASLPVGNYSYSAKINSSDGLSTERGEFSVSPNQLELINTKADHALLYSLAVQNGGKMIMPNELSSLGDTIVQSDEIQSTSYETKSLADLINNRWFLWVLLILLAAEWLLRKRMGTY